MPVPLIEPDFRVPIDRLPGGVLDLVGVALTKDAQTGEVLLVVARPAFNATWWDVLVWHRVELALLLLLPLLWAAWRQWRTVGRGKQDPGLAYCRCCGHELDARLVTVDPKSSEDLLWSSDEARCPACGQRGPRRLFLSRLESPSKGRSRFERNGLLPLIFILTLFGVVSPMTSMIARTPFAGDVTWPVEGLDNLIGSWAPSRSSWDVKRRVRRVYELHRPSDGSVERLFVGGREPVLDQGPVSPGGRFVVGAAKGLGVLIYDVTTSRVRNVGLGTSLLFPAETEVIEFSRDGAAAFVQTTRPLWTGEQRLYRVDLATGRTEEMGRVVPSSGQTQNPGSRRFHVAEDPSMPGRFVWVHTTERSTTLRGGMLSVRWTRDGREFERTFGSTWRPPTFALDAALDRFTVTVPTPEQIPWTRVSLQNGEDVGHEVSDHPLVWTHPGGRGRIDVQTFGEPRVPTLVDRRRGDAVGELEAFARLPPLPAELPQSEARMQGWYATVVEPQVSSPSASFTLGVSRGRRQEVWLLDLAAIEKARDASSLP